MDKFQSHLTQEAIRILGRIMPDRARMDSHDRTFCEDQAYKLNKFGANAQITERMMLRLRQLDMDFKANCPESLPSGDGSLPTLSAAPPCSSKRPENPSKLP